MIEIKPFRAFIYNQEEIENMNNVVAPPYDIISKKEQDAYYRRSKYNIIRLILGKTYSKDTRGNNRYSRTAKLLKKWQKENILIQDNMPCIYVYKQNYYDKQQKRRIDRLGFISLFKIQDFNKKVIYPHEYTLPRPKEDRFKLLKRTKANFSPVFSLYSDKPGKIDKILKKALSKKPFIKITDINKTDHALYRISDSKQINKIQDIMKRKKAFIADGHHRYETALKYRTYSKNSANKEYTMMYFTNLDNKELKIYPIHRLVCDVSLRHLKDLLEDLRKYFDVKKVKDKEKMLSSIIWSKSTDYKYGLYCGRKFYVLILKSKNIVKRVSKKKKLSHVDKLNVTLLHKLVIRRILKASDNKVSYFHDVRELIKQVNKRKNRVGIFVSAIAADEIIKAALENERLPRKSTYFYPKLYSGLVINKIDAL